MTKEIAYFERFQLEIEKDDALSCTHPGPCDQEVAELVETDYIQSQLSQITPDKIRDELAEYGAWDDTELSNNAKNQQRIIWIAAGNIKEETP